MDALAKGWFSELGPMWPGQSMSLEVEEVLFSARSEYQDVLFFRSKSFGTVLCLDGVIQVTDRDQHAYAEMLAHLPLFSHADPKRVLIVGGGDGAVATEVLKHKSVTRVDLCDIDGMVIEKSQVYFPAYAGAFSDPRMNTHVEDANDYMKRHSAEFDVIIVDSSDPIGPAEALFEKPFYAQMRAALRAGGVICTQGECQWLHMDLIGNMLRFCRPLFTHVAYAYTTIPSYPSGQIGFVLCSNGDQHPSQACAGVKDRLLAEKVDTLNYYNDAIHSASFVLPQFAVKALQEGEGDGGNDDKE